jgi:CTP:molybdopterin cytidylyltransferase MocA
MPEDNLCALALLAAGGSRRLGQPKQLVRVGGESLIRRMARACLGAQLSPNIVVLGAHAQAVRKELEDLPLTMVENPHWEEGIASSLRIAVKAALAEEPRITALLVTLADQPNVTTAHLSSLVSAQRSSARSIAAADFGDHLGPPVCFAREHFPVLLALSGDCGARNLLRQFDALPVRMPASAGDDLDTPADLARLIESLPSHR